jgi:hypothetical protein
VLRGCTDVCKSTNLAHFWAGNAAKRIAPWSAAHLRSTIWALHLGLGHADRTRLPKSIFGSQLEFPYTMTHAFQSVMLIGLLQTISRLNLSSKHVPLTCPLIRCKCIYNFLCSMLVFTPIALCFVYTSWHFYTFSGTNLLIRCHSASSSFLLFLCFRKVHRKYSRNWTKRSQSSYLLDTNTESKGEMERGQEVAAP